MAPKSKPLPDAKPPVQYSWQMQNTMKPRDVNIPGGAKEVNLIDDGRGNLLEAGKKKPGRPKKVAAGMTEELAKVNLAGEKKKAGKIDIGDIAAEAGDLLVDALAGKKKKSSKKTGGIDFGDIAAELGDVVGDALAGKKKTGGIDFGDIAAELGDVVADAFAGKKRKPAPKKAGNQSARPIIAPTSFVSVPDSSVTHGIAMVTPKIAGSISHAIPMTNAMEIQDDDESEVKAGKKKGAAKEKRNNAKNDVKDILVQLEAGLKAAKKMLVKVK